MSKIILTGVKPTGMPHLGNYIGAIRPSLHIANQPSVVSYLFVADYHSLTTVHEPKALRRMIYEVSATWLACGLDPEKTIIYTQSSIPELFELNWILSCCAPKGLLNRAHSYKAIIQKNQDAQQKNQDAGVNMGIYNYPILMAADILLFSANEVPVSQDQAQHLEITRDIALKFNHIFKKDTLVPPTIKVTTKLLPGLDGNKMSKRHSNHIPLFCSAEELKTIVMRIKTDSSLPTEPKDPNKSILFSIYKEFAPEESTKELERKYRTGIGWREVKTMLYASLEKVLCEKRKVYHAFMQDTEKIDRILQKGALRAREPAKRMIKKIRKIIGITAP